MALDYGDTGAGRQPTAVFPQVSASGMLLKLLQVRRSQRQAQAPIAYESNIIAAEDNRPEGNVVVAAFVRQLDLDQQILVRLINDGLTAAFIDSSLEPV